MASSPPLTLSLSPRGESTPKKPSPPWGEGWVRGSTLLFKARHTLRARPDATCIYYAHLERRRSNPFGLPGARASARRGFPPGNLQAFHVPQPPGVLAFPPLPRSRQRLDALRRALEPGRDPS